MKDVKYYKSRFENLKSKKKLLHPKWEKINKYVRNGGSLFSDSNDEGASDRVYDSVAPDALRKLSSVLMGLMWPSSKKAMKLERVDGISDSAENKKFYERCTKITGEKLDSPRTGFINALEQHFIDQGSFGTSGIFVSEDEKEDVKFKLWGIKNIVIDEGENGHITSIYYSDKWTAKRIVETYGQEKVSKKVRECFESIDRSGEKFTIVQGIEPKMEKADNGTPFMTFESIHFEDENDHILKKSKFNEFPCPIARFYKDSDNTYGKSPAMILEAAITELNNKVSHREMIEMQEIEPSLGYDVNAFGGDELDTTPGGTNAFDLTNAGPGTPVFRIIPQIRVQITDASITRLEEKIAQGFGLDRLLDFNNSSVMTATESNLRADIRGQALNATFARQDAELFTPVIERTFNILFRKGLFGVMPNSPELRALESENKTREANGLPPKEIYIIPEEIANIIQTGEEFYKITYVSPASAMRDAESLRSLVSAAQQTAQLAQIMPGIMDNIDSDKMARKIFELNRADKTVLRAEEEMKEAREEQAQQQAQQQQKQAEANDLAVEQQRQEVEGAGQ